MNELCCHRMNIVWTAPSYKEGIFSIAGIFLAEKVFVFFKDKFNLILFFLRT